MKPSPALLTAALACAALLPLGAGAQQTPTSPTTTTPTTTSPIRHGHHHPHGLMGALRGVSISDTQRSQIHDDITQFRQAHPKGSAPDPQARKALREQIMNVLTPDQQTQVKANLKAERAARGARHTRPSGTQTNNGVFPPDPTPSASPA
ncbi:MAG: hypothetical protein KGN02_12000 [bacterium]|nr:hypothetical protein [bacterium]